MVTDPKLGLRTTYGAYALQYSTARKSSFIIQKAEEAGAIVLGKTNPEVFLPRYHRSVWKRLIIIRNSAATSTNPSLVLFVLWATLLTMTGASTILDGQKSA